MSNKSPIDPDFWLTIANEREPKIASVTDWFSGNTSPVRPGYYERHYTDGVYRHYWSGTHWHGHKDWPPHWRQVGAYPAWRGLNRIAAQKGTT